MGGPLHSKGVLISSGFLAARYAPEVPVSLAASLVFEQSYAGVDGASLSLAELCAVISALIELQIRQEIAVAGSVDRHGEVQAIGGVNEKVEGFFDICAVRGLTGGQGALIPAANVKTLMLRADVVAAWGEGRFHVHAALHVDEAVEAAHGSRGRPAAVVVVVVVVAQRAASRRAPSTASSSVACAPSPSAVAASRPATPPRSESRKDRTSMRQMTPNALAINRLRPCPGVGTGAIPSRRTPPEPGKKRRPRPAVPRRTEVWHVAQKSPLNRPPPPTRFRPPWAWP